MLKLYGVDWCAITAGPSPDRNKRTEIFLKGCSRALKQEPCEDCFNKSLWSDYIEKVYSPEDVFKQINKYAKNKYITISGGEPLDQYEDLVDLCKLLKEKNYHIIVYTSYTLSEVKKITDLELFKYIDILIDGQYKKEERIYQNNGADGFLNSIGSGNQMIIDTSDINNIYGFEAKHLDMIALDLNNDLHYFLKEKKII